jgi:mono/diheme cytochrome c family protein
MSLRKRGEHVTMRKVLFSLLLFSVPLGAAAQDGAPPGDPAHGKEIFDSFGCGACHGYEGQGSRDGPRLNPPPPFPVVLLQLRQPRNLMPPFREQIVSDQDAADIYAYMSGFPAPLDPDTIRLLQEN